MNYFNKVGNLGYVYFQFDFFKNNELVFRF